MRLPNDIEIMAGAIIVLGLAAVALIVSASDLELVGFFVVTLWALGVGAAGGVAGAHIYRQLSRPDEGEERSW